MRRAVLCLVAGLMATCAHQAPPAPTATVTHTAVIDDTPKRYSLPMTFRDIDWICLDPDNKGTCATVADVKLFLVSRRTE